MSKSIYESYETNPEAENKGVWFDYGEAEAGKQIRFKLALMYRTNKEYSKALDRITRKNARAIEQGALSSEKSEKLLLDLFVTKVLLGWENVIDREGSELAFNAENARKLLTDLPKLYDALRADASDAQNFLEREKESAAKN